MGKRLLPLICICGLLLTGCGNRQEIDDVAVALGVAVDGGSRGGYRVTVELAAPKAPDDLGEGVFFVSEGGDLQQALAALDCQLEKELFWGHLQVILVGESMVSRMEEISEYFHSLRQLATSSLLVTASGPAGDMLRQGFGQADYASFGIAGAVRDALPRNVRPNLLYVMERLQKNRPLDLPCLYRQTGREDGRLEIKIKEETIRKDALGDHEPRHA
ncbi:MAG: hypothetical protein K6B40_06250 [Firmicutes bacterium]|nr:hypothetical protein [Bacillota bacterium]